MRGSNLTSVVEDPKSLIEKLVYRLVSNKFLPAIPNVSFLSINLYCVSKSKK